MASYCMEDEGIPRGHFYSSEEGVPVVRGMKFCHMHDEVLLDICETLFSVSGVLYSVAIPCTDKSSSCFHGIKREDEVANKYLNRRERTYTNPHRIPFMELTEVKTSENNFSI